MYKRIIKGVPRYIFKNEKEFRSTFPDAELIQDWREGEENDWVVTDDNKITQILKRKTMKNTHIRAYDSYFVTLLGPCFASGKMQGPPKKDFHTFRKKDVEEKKLEESKNIRKVFRYQVTMLTNERDEDKQIKIKESIMSLSRTTRELDVPHLRGKTYTQSVEVLTAWLDGFGDDI